MGAFSGGNRRVKRGKGDQYSYSPGGKAGYRPGEGISYSGNGFLGKKSDLSVSLLAFVSWTQGHFAKRQ